MWEFYVTLYINYEIICFFSGGGIPDKPGNIAITPDI